MRILGLACSHRKNGNCYHILRKAFEKVVAEVEIIQLAEHRIEGCTGCGLCKDSLKCVIKDDVGKILNKMMEANSILISCPRYIPIPSKLVALVERLGALVWYYPKQANPDFQNPLRGKPFGIIVVSAKGEYKEVYEVLSKVAFYFTSCLEMELITADSYPYLGVSAKGGENKKEVFKDSEAIDNATKLVENCLRKLKEGVVPNYQMLHRASLSHFQCLLKIYKLFR
jgi:multimeric flavodoxin WrbA